MAGSRLLRAGATLLLPFLGVVAAFGIAPDTVTAPVPRARVVQELALPDPVATNPADEGYWREERVQRGDTIATLLARLGADDPDALRTLRTVRSARTLYQLVPGKAVRALIAPDGRLLALRYLSGGSVLQVYRRGDVFKVAEAPAKFERRVLMRSGEIRNSLFAATDVAGLPDGIATQIADIFSTDVDFHRDLRRGDRFAVVYEMFYDEGEPAQPGRVLAAEFTNRGRSYRALYFEYAQGRGGYYAPGGRSIRKAFLRSPLEYSRISSGFTRSRFHPVLRKWRAHQGIDYAAASGTRVRATGDGVVDFSGRDNSGYGNLVVLRHPSGYTTWYGHLSGFARGLRKGVRVAQGDTIAFVGATGLVTGPHLHYEFRVNGVPQDPLRIVMPPAPPIGSDQMPAFEAAAAPLMQRLELMQSIGLARLD